MKILLIAYDNGSYMHTFPQGIAYISAVLLSEGYEVEIYNQDAHHYPDQHLTEYLNKNKFDIIGLGVIGGYYQYQKLLKISKAINKSKQRPFFIIGGHGPSPEPEFFLRKTHADAAVIGEGEITILDLLKAVSNNSSLYQIRGIAYRDGEKVIINERRPLIEDIDGIPFPAYQLFPMSYYRLFREPLATNNDFTMSVLSGRGCPFKCTFCYRMDKGFRPRSNEAIIEEVELLKGIYGITYVNFSDELLMSSAERVENLCKDLIRKNLGIKWTCNGRLNFARREVLQLMKKAGCVFINYGIEALDNNVLKHMKKALTVDVIIKGIEATLKAGISPGFNIIFGNIGDNKRTLDKAVEFLLKYDDGAQLRTIRPVTPYPGSPLYYYALERGLIKDCEDFYENKHLNSDLLSVNFTEMSDAEFHNCLYEANTRLINNYFEHKHVDMHRQTKELFLDRNVNFRGYRHT